MISGLAAHGLGSEVVILFRKMKSEEVVPDGVTFAALLTACSHCGMVEEARHYFNSMARDYSITPEVEHYGALVDTLSRAGLLDEAYNFLELEQLKSLHTYNAEEKISGVKTEWPATILVFDIETSGFSRRDDRIIEFAVRDLMGGKNSTFQTLINPDRDVRNTYVHGISNSMLCRPDVPRFGELIPILLQYVWSRQMDGKPVLWVAHNGRSFDVPFLIFEFRRCKVEMPGDWLFVDTLPIARQLVDSKGSKLSSVSLEKLRERYEIPLTGSAHRAMQDVTTLCYVLQKLTFELKLTVPQLLEKSFRPSDLPASRPEK
nr:unnamed protein product [Digitaria exilis]